MKDWLVQQRVDLALAEAERKAWDSLGRYKFQMFGYWAAIWVHLNRVGGFKRPNPFALLVAHARRGGACPPAWAPTTTRAIE